MSTQDEALDAKQIAGRIKAIRGKLGLSQSKLAEKADLSFSTIQKLEIGEREASRETYGKLATALGVTPSFLAYGSAPRVLELPDVLTDEDVKELQRNMAYLANIRHKEQEERKRYQGGGGSGSGGGDNYYDDDNEPEATDQEVRDEAYERSMAKQRELDREKRREHQYQSQ